MSEIAQSGGGGSKDGKVRVKKSSTKIDMTPMVDLAFLLLTFFILTTTLNKPQTMELNMPEKEKEGDKPPEVNEKKVVTLILGPSDKIYWYVGITDPVIQLTNFSKDGIRKIITQKNAEIPGMIILIKPGKDSRYKNMVDILDEMTISTVQRFAMVKITTVDEELITESNL
ncbi:MAG TPA: biopolymer transporter ExbD [Chryseolinea sp.]|nr:biopolymer transporter ExbD [Chryseolinea sp.]